MIKRWLEIGIAAVLIVTALYFAVSSSLAPHRPDTGHSASYVRPSSTRSELSAPLVPFLDLLARDQEDAIDAVPRIEAGWDPTQAVMLVEMLPYLRNPEVSAGVVSILETKTGKDFGTDRDQWLDYIWDSNPGLHPNYAEFKAGFYGGMDPLFSEYFKDNPAATIRLDEIRWGGVVRDGIPPLKDPKIVSATQATYLDDGNVVFGVEINGDARAYPKRILGWHEMVKDTVGGESINGVYCTLCGSMIIYRTTVDSVHYELGTSGFLYRSNKLMYDHGTKSMWSTLTGEPVVGQLVGKGIKLELLHVVTTTWGEWRRRHPETKVLSLATGHRRDYGEGVAYKKYFATDDLMFTVPKLDTRLKNKAEVLALRFPEYPEEQLAIAAKFLAKNPVYQDRIGTVEFVVLTDKSEANRVYETKGLEFESWDRDQNILDAEGESWEVTEAQLVSKDGQSLKRLPAHRAFWFGWYSAYPETRLVK